MCGHGCMGVVKDVLLCYVCNLKVAHLETLINCATQGDEQCMKLVQFMQTYEVQDKCGKHAGSYRTRFAGKYSAIANAMQEFGPHVFDIKQKNQQRLKRYTTVILIDMISDMAEHLEELEKQVYIICVAQLNVLFN